MSAESELHHVQEPENFSIANNLPIISEHFIDPLTLIHDPNIDAHLLHEITIREDEIQRTINVESLIGARTMIRQLIQSFIDNPTATDSERMGLFWGDHLPEGWKQKNYRDLISKSIRALKNNSITDFEIIKVKDSDEDNASFRYTLSRVNQEPVSPTTTPEPAILIDETPTESNDAQIVEVLLDGQVTELPPAESKIDQQDVSGPKIVREETVPTKPYFKIEAHTYPDPMVRQFLEMLQDNPQVEHATIISTFFPSLDVHTQKQNLIHLIRDAREALRLNHRTDITVTRNRASDDKDAPFLYTLAPVTKNTPPIASIAINARDTKTSTITDSAPPISQDVSALDAMPPFPVSNPHVVSRKRTTRPDIRDVMVRPDVPTASKATPTSREKTTQTRTLSPSETTQFDSLEVSFIHIYLSNPGTTQQEYAATLLEEGLSIKAINTIFKGLVTKLSKKGEVFEFDEDSSTYTRVRTNSGSPKDTETILHADVETSLADQGKIFDPENYQAGKVKPEIRTVIQRTISRTVLTHLRERRNISEEWEQEHTEDEVKISKDGQIGNLGRNIVRIVQDLTEGYRDPQKLFERKTDDPEKEIFYEMMHYIHTIWTMQKPIQSLTHEDRLLYAVCSQIHADGKNWNAVQQLLEDHFFPPSRRRVSK